VIVVDNASADDSVSVAHALADVVVANPRNRGFGAAQNQGVALATTPYVLLLNPDAEVHTAGLDVGSARLDTDPSVAMVEGQILRASDGSPERWCGSRPGTRDLVARLLRLRERLGEDRLRWLARRVGAADYDQRIPIGDRTVDFLAAVAPLVRRDAFVAVGGFDEKIFLYAEDVDLSARLQRAGGSLLAVDAVWATHIGGASSSASRPTRDHLWWTSHYYVVRTTWTGPRRWVGLVVARLGVRSSRRRLASQA
jgi:GT2 family glycosyltransferase